MFHGVTCSLGPLGQAMRRLSVESGAGAEFDVPVSVVAGTATAPVASRRGRTTSSAATPTAMAPPSTPPHCRRLLDRPELVNRRQPTPGIPFITTKRFQTPAWTVDREPGTHFRQANHAGCGFHGTLSRANCFR